MTMRRCGAIFILLCLLPLPGEAWGPKRPEPLPPTKDQQEVAAAAKEIEGFLNEITRSELAATDLYGSHTARFTLKKAVLENNPSAKAAADEASNLASYLYGPVDTALEPANPAGPSKAILQEAVLFLRKQQKLDREGMEDMRSGMEDWRGRYGKLMRMGDQLLEKAVELAFVQADMKATSSDNPRYSELSLRAEKLTREIQDVGDQASKLFTPPPFGPLEYVAPSEYQIAELDINYDGWEKNNDHLRLAMEKSRAAADAAKAKFEAAQKAAALKQEEVRQKDHELARIRGRIAEAYQRTQAGPSESEKTSEYRVHENTLLDLENQLEQVMDKIAQAQKSGTDPGPQLAIYERLEAQAGKHRAKLRELEDKMGIGAKIEQAKKDLAGRMDEYWAAFGEHYKLLPQLNMARSEESSALIVKAHAEEKYTQDHQAWEKFAPEDAPRIREIWAKKDGRYVYSVEFWMPEKILEALNEAIPELKRTLDELDEARKRGRYSLEIEHGEAMAALKGVETGIKVSAGVQALVELGFMARDVVEAAGKGGPMGALAEGSKKVIESWIFGGPNFYDPEVTTDYAEALLPKVWETAESAETRKYKTLGTGLGMDALVGYYLSTKNWRVFMESYDKLFSLPEVPGETLMPGGKTARQLKDAIAGDTYQKYQLYKEAEKKFQDAKKTFTFQKLAEAVRTKKFSEVGKALKEPGKKFAKGLVKDFSKAQIKQLAANLFEGTAWLDFIREDHEARAAAYLLRMASGRYHEAKDRHKAAVDARDEIVKQYDAKNSMQIREKGPFKEGDELVIEMVDATRWYDKKDFSKLPKREIEVYLGAKKAESFERREDTPLKSFKIKAKRLRHDGQGGVKLEVRVIR